MRCKHEQIVLRSGTLTSAEVAVKLGRNKWRKEEKNTNLVLDGRCHRQCQPSFLRRHCCFYKGAFTHGTATMAFRRILAFVGFPNCLSRYCWGPFHWRLAQIRGWSKGLHRHPQGADNGGLHRRSERCLRHKGGWQNAPPDGDMDLVCAWGSLSFRCGLLPHCLGLCCSDAFLQLFQFLFKTQLQVLLGLHRRLGIFRHYKQRQGRLVLQNLGFLEIGSYNVRCCKCLGPNRVVSLLPDALFLFRDLCFAWLAPLGRGWGTTLRGVFNHNIGIFLVRPQRCDRWAAALLSHKQRCRRSSARTWTYHKCPRSSMLPHLAGPLHPTGDILQNKWVVDKKNDCCLGCFTLYNSSAFWSTSSNEVHDSLQPRTWL